MTTRKEFHGHISFMDRLLIFKQSIIDKIDEHSPPLQNKAKFEKWRCVPLQQGLNVQYITASEYDIEETLKGLALLNGQVVELIRKSDTEYKVTFKNNRVYKIIKYF
ncbi:hypothetical protein ACQKNX_08095 [Lysinibacillus sp. NPDC093712]|uniref:hypothetical protein n=1 Tax=Lysinibacillus sp. NPDC093712 TaxID=3390579 RepID=UPI003D070930